MKVEIPNPSDVTGFEFLLSIVKSLKHSELSKLRNEIDNLMEIDLPLLRFKAYEVFSKDGVIHAVKFVKDSTGWNLKESKEFVDGLRESVAGGISFQKIN